MRFDIRKLIYILIAVFVSSIAVISFYNITLLKEKIYNEKKKSIKNIVQTTFSAIEYYQKLPIPDQQKKKLIKQLINSLRFEKNNYFWIITDTLPPKMVIHPLDKNLNGKTLTSKQFDCSTMIESNNTVKKLNNENLFTAMVSLVKKADNGYIIYKWKKPDSNKTVQKLSYIIKIPHYNWILGSGIYIDDIEKEYKNTLFQYLKFIIPLFFLIIILTAVILKKINTLQKKLHAKQKSIENIAYTDQLTELLNRASFDKKFEEILNESCKKNKKFSILFLDLDNFKPINDTYGHDIGDKVLKIVAKRVKNSLRKNDIIARIGGDEFVVLLPEVSKENISEIIMKLNNAVKKPIKIDSLLIQTSVSIGYSVYPDDGKNKFDLIKKADKLMYLDKQQKKQKD